ncbi:histone-lysine N-methyltransferase SETMAR [Trichonephila clavipes]|nr:histone-lysine N-methyltransferase SETMAR [Trichonephila clavipes]
MGEFIKYKRTVPVRRDSSGFGFAKQKESPIEILKFISNLNFAPKLGIVLRILLTLPISVASGERNFSKLKLIKKFLRSTTTEDRLNGLTTIAIEHELPEEINVKEIIKKILKIKNAPRSGRPVEADKDAIKALVDANRRITTREIGLRLNLSNSTVYDHLKGLGLSSKLDVWVPHVLTERNLCRRIDVCDSLLNENDSFLKRIITGDEKGHGAKKMN